MLVEKERLEKVEKEQHGQVDKERKDARNGPQSMVAVRYDSFRRG